jgi:hypothetical protein
MSITEEEDYLRDMRKECISMRKKDMAMATDIIEVTDITDEIEKKNKKPCIFQGFLFIVKFCLNLILALTLFILNQPKNKKI